MTREFRKMATLCSVLTLLGAAAWISLVTCDPLTTMSGHGTGDADTDQPAGVVRIQGNVTEPIAPGVRVPLDLTLINPQDLEVSITHLTVAVAQVDAPNSDATHVCTVEDFTVDQAPHDLRITLAARATNTLSGLGLPSTTWPRMGMHDRPVNQDNCKGASLTLSYTASATGGTQ
ncbi:hypothetical protein [Amycolatopsis sp. cmx-4-68]|uniref:hypothetical protein n=1 Tax=Amycolatopsis sp. cmx-4-68 TaxID=2790938 RepID=UPI00397CABF2